MFMSSFTASVLPSIRATLYRIPPSCHNDDRDTQVVAKHVAVNLRRHWNKKNDDNDRLVDELKVGKMRMKDDINSNVSI